MVKPKHSGAHMGALLLCLLCWATPLVAQEDSDEDWFDDFADEDEPLRGEALEHALPRLRIAQGLPGLRLAPGIHALLPYQILGLSVPIEMVPVPWLRVGLIYAFGISPTGNEPAWGNYGEGFLGVRVANFSHEAAVDVPLEKRRPLSFRALPAVKAWIPVQRGLFLEAGVITAFASLPLCSFDEDCEVRFGTTNPPTEDRQLLLPAGGIRFAHYYAIRSEQRRIGQRYMLQVFAHALLQPHNKSNQTLYLFSKRAKSQPVGVRVGLEMESDGCPASWLFDMGCATGRLAFGVAPYPATLLFEFHVGYPLYP